MSNPDPRDPGALRRRYDGDYFARYDAPTRLGTPAGERPFFYGYWARFLTRRLPAGAKVLEVGAGGGWFQTRLCERFAALAVDISTAAAQRVRERTGAARVACADAQALPFPDAAFAALIAFDLIEHLPEPERFLAEARRVLAPGGYLIASTPNPDSLGARLKRDPMPAGGVWTEHLRVWHGRRDDTHINIRPPAAWRQACADAGLTLERQGTDFCWDTPYFRRVPLLLEKLIGNGGNHLVNATVGFLPWGSGENYFLVARRPAGTP